MSGVLFGLILNAVLPSGASSPDAIPGNYCANGLHPVKLYKEVDDDDSYQDEKGYYTIECKENA